MVAHAYEKLGLIAQIEVLGNNAHAFDAQSCATLVGSAQEPSMLHGHVLGRGNPSHDYIRGVSLKGPRPGEIFKLRGNSVKELLREVLPDAVEPEGLYAHSADSSEEAPRSAIVSF